MSWPDWKYFNESRINEVPENSGVYQLDTGTETLYIGKSDNIRSRLMEHLNSDDRCIKQATLFKYMVTTSPERTEDELLKNYMQAHGKLPKCNEKRD